jgi:hypothetical protein
MVMAANKRKISIKNALLQTKKRFEMMILNKTFHPSWKLAILSKLCCFLKSIEISVYSRQKFTKLIPQKFKKDSKEMAGFVAICFIAMIVRKLVRGNM